MYHSVLKDESKRGKYVVTPTDIENDFKYLKENGYTAVFMKDLTAFAYEGTPLPEKPVVLTFDDGYYNNYTYVYPLAQQYGMKIVISLVGAYTDAYTETPDPNPAYAHLTWSDAKAMQESGIAEFQNHTYNLHSLDGGRMGCKKKKGESDAHYTQLLNSDIGSMQKKIAEHLGSAAEVFTYPYGGVSNDSFEIIRSLGFKASLSCIEGINHLTGDTEELYMLKRCIRSDKRSVEKILK
jgi:peptidoglycan/xylan/chitin deacetylase (PgdA/CDA1 family)